MMNTNSIIDDFPILKRTVKNNKIVYLDNAATTHKPISVIEAVSSYYNNNNSNIHRGNHTLANESTEIYENARINVKRFINAPNNYDIVFVKNATEAINIVANGISPLLDNNKKEYTTTIIEHHANFVPWQQHAIRNNMKFNVMGNDYNDLSMINDNTAIIASTMASNVTGEILDYHSIVRKANEVGAYTLLDAAQSAPHMMLDIEDSKADFYAFSAHKMLGPTGIGVLVGRKDLLDNLMPYSYGGEMISKVTIDNTQFQKSPYRFEAGTMPLAQSAGFNEALSYLNRIGRAKIKAHANMINKTIKDCMEDSLPKDTTRILSGHNTGLLPIISLYHPKVHHNDIGLMLDSMGIAVRTGHHCAMPFMNHKKISGTLRASAYIYNNEDDITSFFSAYKNAVNKIL
ncbi:MAG: aminotransferase class V-fold PLP-dependent enzyme [Candidatus Woesearchaeota archaeon]